MNVDDLQKEMSLKSDEELLAEIKASRQRRTVSKPKPKAKKESKVKTNKVKSSITALTKEQAAALLAELGG